VPTAAAASTAASSSAVKAVSAVASVEISPKDIDQLVKDMIAATHKLVRSQMTWFR
jgi:tRNA A37 N6-isopentenylltransferase MiaA